MRIYLCFLFGAMRIGSLILSVLFLTGGWLVRYKYSKQDIYYYQHIFAFFHGVSGIFLAFE